MGALINGGEFKEGVDTFFGFIDKTDIPKLECSPEYKAGNRFAFYFSKVLYEKLKEPCPNMARNFYSSMPNFRCQCGKCDANNQVSGIDTANTKVGECSWARGIRGRGNSLLPLTYRTRVRVGWTPSRHRE